MTYDELRGMAQEYVEMMLDEIRDDALEYAESELDLDGVQADQFVDCVQAIVYPDK